MLTCRDVSEMATDYMERALPLRQWLGVRLHLLLCGMCRAYLEQLHKTRALLGGRSMPPPGEETEASLVAARRHGEG